MLSEIISTDSDRTLAIARVLLGVVFFAHGAQKLLGWFHGAGLTQTMRSMTEQLRIPFPLALAAVSAEFFGGGALIVGLFSRLAALAITAIMLAAIWMVHGRHGLFLDWFSEGKGHGFEYHLLAIAVALVIIFQGAGAFSLDGLFSRWIENQARLH
jgi:putative oxidoreductase